MPMVKKMFLGIIFFILSILFTQSVLAADINIDHNVELNKVCKPMNCVVPIPTLVDPQEDIIKIDQDFYLTGLTWNDTKIYIYVDNVYQGEAVVVNDEESDTANFYYLIENNSLLEGQHEWKVIAWTKSMHKRSYVSTENNFTIEAYFTAPQLDRITTDIDNNNWLVGVAENNSIVSIYVDNIYQGEVRTDGNFNYKLGNLSSGLHTVYAIARDAHTGKTSKRSNLLSEHITEYISIPVEEPEPIEPEEPVVPEEPEPIEPEEPENQISSISEPEEDNGIIIQNEESQDNVNVAETEEHDVEVGVINHEESQDQLVVDIRESELNQVKDETDIVSEDVTVTEELQPASLENEEIEIIMEELDVVEKQQRNRKVGLWLLIILIVIVVVSTFLSEKRVKIKSKDLRKEDDDLDSHQGDLFDR
jgi:hypothetical protein